MAYLWLWQHSRIEHWETPHNKHKEVHSSSHTTHNIIVWTKRKYTVLHTTHSIIVWTKGILLDTNLNCKLYYQPTL